MTKKGSKDNSVTNSPKEPTVVNQFSQLDEYTVDPDQQKEDVLSIRSSSQILAPPPLPPDANPDQDPLPPPPPQVMAVPGKKIIPRKMPTPKAIPRTIVKTTPQTPLKTTPQTPLKAAPEIQFQKVPQNPSAKVPTTPVPPKAEPQKPEYTTPVPAQDEPQKPEYKTPVPTQAEPQKLEHTKIEALPLENPVPRGENSWVTTFQVFKKETQKLARRGSWRQLAALYGYALNNSPFSSRMTRTGMLLDLARIYRDRLQDPHRAEQIFLVLHKEKPSNKEALNYLINQATNRLDWIDVYTLYSQAVEATWDPNERLEWTRKAAHIVTSRIKRVDLALAVWEKLWKLGDWVEEASQALTRYYRMSGRWKEMATFLEQQSAAQEDPEKTIVQRELAEIYRTPLQDLAATRKVLEDIIARNPKDPIVPLQLAKVYAQLGDQKALEKLGSHLNRSTKTSKADTMGARSLELQRLIADSHWQNKNSVQAADTYCNILAQEPGDKKAYSRAHQHFQKTQQHDKLLKLIKDQIAITDKRDDKIRLIEEAARLAETQLKSPNMAVKLWEKYIKEAPGEVAPYVSTHRLYQHLSDYKGVARAIEGRIRLTLDNELRITLLQELGSLYSSKLNDDSSAEKCWKSVLSIDSRNHFALGEFQRLHRKRKDFEALNSALLRQMWLSDNFEQHEKLCRESARNLDENMEDPKRSVEAWTRVLDLLPQDHEALVQLKNLYGTLGNKWQLAATIEQEIQYAPQPQQKELTFELAQLLMEESKDGEPPAHTGVIAAFERILFWQPQNRQALSGLLKKFGKKL